MSLLLVREIEFELYNVLSRKFHLYFSNSTFIEFPSLLRAKHCVKRWKCCDSCLVPTETGRERRFRGRPTRKHDRRRLYRRASGRGCDYNSEWSGGAASGEKGRVRRGERRKRRVKESPGCTVSHWLLTRQNQLLSSVGRASI